MGNYTITGSGIGMTTMFGAMLSGRGDRVKGLGAAAVACDQEDGQDYGAGAVLNANLGEFTTYQLYSNARQTHILEAVLNGGGPVNVDAGG